MLDRDRTWHNYSNDFRWQKPVFPRPESFLLNLSLNILSRLFSSHTLNSYPKLSNIVSQRRNAKALQTGVHSSIIFLRKTSELYIRQTTIQASIVHT